LGAFFEAKGPQSKLEAPKNGGEPMPKRIAPLLIPKSELSNLPKKTKNFLMVEDFFFS